MSISERQPKQRYHVLQRIDAGGMAEIFKGKLISMEGFERLVAIKRVLPNLVENERFLRMFLDEAKLTLNLTHANIVQVFDLGYSGDTYFIVMEYVEGANLKVLMETLNKVQLRLTVPQAVYIMREVCKGLAHAHQKRDLNGKHLNIVHRDVSPPNVLLSLEGEVKLTDFGLAKARSQVELTDPGVVKGKFGYLSPEAARGEEVDNLSDIFACGIVLWEMLASRRLFLADTDMDTIKLVRTANIPSLAAINPEVSPDLERICGKALAKNKDDRYLSAQDLGRDLADFLYAVGTRTGSEEISALVRQAVRFSRLREDGKPSSNLNRMVEQEVNRLIQVERDAVDITAEDREEVPLQTSTLEDPRTWGEDIFDSGESDQFYSVEQPMSGEDWPSESIPIGTAELVKVGTPKPRPLPIEDEGEHQVVPETPHPTEVPQTPMPARVPYAPKPIPEPNRSSSGLLVREEETGGSSRSLTPFVIGFVAVVVVLGAILAFLIVGK